LIILFNFAAWNNFVCYFFVSDEISGMTKIIISMDMKKIAFLLLLFLFFISTIFAQTDTLHEENANYYIDRSEAELRFVQRILWDKADHALRYVLILQQQQQNRTYREIERISVEETFAEVSLRAGQYRYQVEVYDLIDEYSFTTEWREFTVIRALQPELSGFSPQRFYLDEDDTWEINLRGRNLLPGSEIYLVQENNRTIKPQSHSSNGTTSHLVFSEISLVPGQYKVYVKNPGGLDVSLGTFSISYKKLVDMNISLGYAPIIPLYGFLFRDIIGGNKDMEAPFPGDFHLVSAAAKINLIPFKRSWGYLGIEASASITYLQHEREAYATEAFFLNTHLGLLYQKYFIKNTFAVNINLGAGFTTVMDFFYEYPKGAPTEKITSFSPSALAGFSFVVFFSKSFHLNTGADFIQVFTPDDPFPGFIRPYLMAGLWL
jgi:hypothetical protein